MEYRCIVARQPALADQPQDVLSQLRELADQTVGVELAARVKVLVAPFMQPQPFCLGLAGKLC